MNNEEEDGQIISTCIVLHKFCLQYDGEAIRSLAETVDDEDNTMQDERLDHDEDAYRKPMAKTDEDE